MLKGKINILFGLLIIIAVAMEILVTKNILFDVYKWHLVQPETYEGVSQLLIILIIFIITIFLFKRNYKISIFIMLIFLYLLNTNLLLPTLLGIFYFEIIFSIGVFIQKSIKKDQKIITKTLNFYLNSFLIGFSIWAIISLISSLLGFGTINDIRILTLVLFLISISRGLNKSFTSILIEGFKGFSKKGQIIISLLIVVVLGLLTKSNRAIDYDSIWYGLRPEYVLLGEKSFFESLGLVQFVHYYPKLFELFTLPVSGLNDYSFIYVLNIIFYILSSIVIYKVVHVLVRNDISALICTLLISTIPALANISATAKPDLFSTFFLLFATYKIIEFAVNNKSEEIGLGISALLIAICAKSTSFLYVPFVGLGLILILVYKFKYEELNLKVFIINSRKYWWIFITSFLVFLLTCYRTYKLTGYPVYPSGLSLWNKLGFENKYPVTANHDVDGLEIHFSFSHIVERWYKLFMDPSEYGHIIMLWTGHVSLFLIISCILFVLFKQFVIINNNSLKLSLIFLPLILIGLIFATFMRNGGDGNYFIIPIIFGIILFFVTILYHLKDKTKVKYINGILLIFIPFQLVLTLVSHSSWQWGTQEFTDNYNLYTKEGNEDIITSNGLKEIEEYILSVPLKTRAIGVGNEQVLHHLPTRLEHLSGIASDHLGNEDILSTEENFYEYLKWAEIDFIIVNKNEKSKFDILNKFIVKFEKNNSGLIVESPEYYLFDIRNLDFNQLNHINFVSGWYEVEGNYRWINKEAKVLGESGALGEIGVEGIVPEKLYNVVIQIYVNNTKVYEQKHSQGEFNINISTLKNSNIELDIKVDKSFIPKEDGDSIDMRELSLIINKLSIN